MSVRHTMLDADFTKGEIVVDQGDLTIAFVSPSDEFIVEIGENVYTQANKKLIEIRLEEMRNKLREANWPNGPLATNFALMLNIDDGKSGILTGNAATAPAGLEDGIRISYNLPIVGASTSSGGTSPTGMGGSGSSVNRGAILDRFAQFIREALATIPVIPGG